MVTKKMVSLKLFHIQLANNHQKNFPQLQKAVVLTCLTGYNKQTGKNCSDASWNMQMFRFCKHAEGIRERKNKVLM